MDSDPEVKLRSLISQQLSPDSTASEDISLMIEIISLVISIDFESRSKQKPESELMSLIKEAIYVLEFMDLDSQPEPLSEFISAIIQKWSLVNSVESDSESMPDSEIKSLFERSLELKPTPKLISIIHKILFLFMANTDSDSDSDSKAERELNMFKDYFWAFSFIHEKKTLGNAEPESKLLSLISQLTCLLNDSTDFGFQFVVLIFEIISLVTSIDLESQPKPESELMSLVTQVRSAFYSIDFVSLLELLSKFTSLTSQQNSPHSSEESELFSFYLEERSPKPESELMSLVAQVLSAFYSIDSVSQSELLSKFTSLTFQPEPEILSLTHQIVSLIISLNSASGNHLFLCPQVDVRLVGGKFHHVTGEEERSNNNIMWGCHPRVWTEISLQAGNLPTHFLCRGCFGKNHKFNRLPLEIKHILHLKHSLQLVFLNEDTIPRECNCCEEGLKEIFYYCWLCDYAMNIACAEKQPLLSIDHPKWHEHTLTLFPRKSSLTCNLCALSDSRSPLYICLPCDFVVHQSCNSLPHVIRISRHPHRISFNHSFDRGDWSCGVCRQDINNIYGGYSCIKDGCSYVAHSRCATQRNVWDGIELEDVPEETEEQLEPFVTISKGIIQHFSHQQHYLKLDENTSREYDDSTQCQACITPIYSGNFYSCVQCDFILHEECAHLSRKIHNPIHPHLLTLVGRSDGVLNYSEGRCTACCLICTSGFFYECGKKECHGFKLHVQCATLSEPLVHGSHPHSLFLTSKPEEQRRCSVCKEADIRSGRTNETFNCIKGECGFSLCFECATLPQKLRYKHDKHTLILSYGEETSTMIYWCELCEEKVNPKERFYKCEEYCCVTLHIKCLIGNDLYLRPGSLWFKWERRMVDVLPNKHMSRPFCWTCEKRCPYKIVFKCSGLVFCSISCTRRGSMKRKKMK